MHAVLLLFVSWDHMLTRFFVLALPMGWLPHVMALPRDGSTMGWQRGVEAVAMHTWQCRISKRRHHANSWVLYRADGGWPVEGG